MVMPGVPAAYYRYARDVAGLDFAALTDHDDMLDDAEWAESKRVTNSFDEPGRFSTLLAYEWTHWVHGHRCVYFAGDDAPIFRRTTPPTDTPAGLWAALRRSGAAVMTIAHHTRGLRGAFNGGQAEIDWHAFPPPPDLERLVETYSIHGHCENEELAGPDFIGRKGFVQDALRQGLHLGLTDDGLATNEAAPRYTYSTIGLYRHRLFSPPYCDIVAGNPQGSKAPLAPILRAAIRQGLVSAALYTGRWVDVGTPERLAQLNQVSDS